MIDRRFDKTKGQKTAKQKKLERSSRRARSWSGQELMDSSESLRQRVKEWEANLAQIAEDIDRLKIFYDQFSIGVRKRVPYTERIRLERMIRAYSLPRGAPARIKFKMTNLVQRYTLLKTHWDRIEREIEMGNYRRRLGRRESFETEVAPPTPGIPRKAAPKKTTKKVATKAKSKSATAAKSKAPNMTRRKKS
jgi:hypothetical protein